MIYVMCHDGGQEGYSGPVLAFTDEHLAIAALRLANAGSETCMVLFEVPAWPDTAQKSYWNIEPMKFDLEGRRMS